MPQIIYVLRRIKDNSRQYQEVIAYYSKEATAQKDAAMSNKDLQNRNIDNVHYYVAPIALIED